MFGENPCATKICSYFKIILVPVPLDPGVRGILLHCAELNIILYDNTLMQRLQCEAVWHEIYHFIFGTEAEPNVSYGDDDIKARAFALFMLYDQVQSKCCLQNKCVYGNVQIKRDWIPLILEARGLTDK